MEANGEMGEPKNLPEESERVFLFLLALALRGTSHRNAGSSLTLAFEVVDNLSGRLDLMAQNPEMFQALFPALSRDGQAEIRQMVEALEHHVRAIELSDPFEDS